MLHIFLKILHQILQTQVYLEGIHKFCGPFLDKIPYVQTLLFLSSIPLVWSLWMVRTGKHVSQNEHIEKW